MKLTDNRIVGTIIITVITIGFTACGGTNDIEGFEGNSYEEINISKSCTSPDKVDDYISLKSGDQIVKDSEGTQISILHDENSVKKICLKSGTAHINRANTE
jgi:hypothetical protein